jgi:capsular polysaccharide biosynthesis protein
MESFKVYQLKVPAYPATTITSMKIKQQIWPVIYAPPRKYEPEEWTAGEVKWATAIMGQVAAYALSDQRKDEVHSDFFCVPGR